MVIAHTEQTVVLAISVIPHIPNIIHAISIGNPI